MPGPDVRELWIACHGYGQLAGPFAAALEPLEHSSRIVAVPEAMSRFYLDDPAKRHGPDSPIGASWMTREDREHEIADYVEYLDLVASTMQAEIGSTPPIVALGFSQGAATACRWASLGTTTVRRLIVWAGTVPTDLPFERGGALFRGAEVVFVGGRKDALARPDALERDQRALADLGVQASVIWHDGGHALSTPTLRALARPQ
jgi:predicted esterase